MTKRYSLLSEMEARVVDLKKEGLNFREIGEELGIDQRTAWTYYNRVEKKRDMALNTIHSLKKLVDVDIVFPQETSGAMVSWEHSQQTPSGLRFNLRKVHLWRGGESPKTEFHIEGHFPYGELRELDNRMTKYSEFEMDLVGRGLQIIESHKVALKDRKIEMDGWFDTMLEKL